jgi:hypothetical protein
MRDLDAIRLDNLPADLYSSFDDDRRRLKQGLAQQGIEDPDTVWLPVYLDAEKLKDDDTWLKGPPAIAREAMDVLLKWLR